MNGLFLSVRKAALISAILLVTATGAWAQLNWSGRQILTNGQTVSQNITLTGNVTIDVPSYGTATISGIISGNYTIRKTGSGTLYLTGDNTYTGTTTIDTGTVYIGNGGTTGSIAGNITFGNNNSYFKSLYFNRSNTYTYSGIISGNGSVYQNGTGTLILNGASTTLATIAIISSGTLELGLNGTIENTILIFYDLNTHKGKFKITSDKQIGGLVSMVTDDSSEIQLLGGNLTIYDTTSDLGLFNYAGIISGTGGIIKTGNQKLILTGNNTYTGATAINAGMLQIGNSASGSIDSTAGVTIGSNGILRFEPGSNKYFGKLISGAGRLEYKGVGFSDLVLTNPQYTGTTTIENAHIKALTSSFPSSAIVLNVLPTAGGIRFEVPAGQTLQYNGVISGTGNVGKFGSGKLILTAANTHTGHTASREGILQIGDGISGSIDNTSQVIVDSGAVLRFEPGVDTRFTKVITGAGSVEYSGINYKLWLDADNTYTGTTTIEGRQGKAELVISYMSPTGSIVGDIINNGRLRFNRSGDYTYSGVISGTGYISQYCSGTLTLNGVNTYSGVTEIYRGTVVLGAGGSIENSSSVNFVGIEQGKFDITSSNKKIKGLNSNEESPNAENAEVILGTSTLTIGTDGQNDGGGTFKGIFTGSGNITKTGTDKFVMSGNNTATGLFSHNNGTVEISSKWMGNYSQAPNTCLNIIGEVSMDKNLTLSGGTISMDLTQATPSKITVAGAVSAVGTTTLNIYSGNVSNRVLVQAASGISDINPYSLNMPGFTASLVANNIQLMLTATITDSIPPTVGTGVNGTASATSANLTWTAASDNVTSKEALRYYVYQSLSDNINTVADCEANGTLLNPIGTMDITTYIALGLIAGTTYYFNVVVADHAGNKSVYTTRTLIARDEQITSVTISPKPASVQPGQTKQFNVTVTTLGNADEGVTWSLIGNTSVQTAISSGGLLTVGSNETAASLVVKAVSDFDTTVFDRVNVTITTTGIEDVILPQLRIYPNPTMGELRIENVKGEINDIEIFDIMGRKVYLSTRSFVDSSTITIDVSYLPSGVYFLKIDGRTIKVIKN